MVQSKMAINKHIIEEAFTGIKKAFSNNFTSIEYKNKTFRKFFILLETF